MVLLSQCNTGQAVLSCARSTGQYRIITGGKRESMRRLHAIIADLIALATHPSVVWSVNWN